MRISDWSSDVCSSDLSHQFISDFAFYLKSERKMQHNSCNDYIKKLKKVVRSCVANGWLQNDPFFAYKIKNKATQPIFLTKDELQAIQEKQFGSDRRSEEHTSELQSLMRISYAVFCLKKQKI